MYLCTLAKRIPSVIIERSVHLVYVRSLCLLNRNCRWTACCCSELFSEVNQDCESPILMSWDYWIALANRVSLLLKVQPKCCDCQVISGDRKWLYTIVTWPCTKLWMYHWNYACPAGIVDVDTLLGVYHCWVIHIMCHCWSTMGYYKSSIGWRLVWFINKNAFAFPHCPFAVPKSYAFMRCDRRSLSTRSGTIATCSSNLWTVRSGNNRYHMLGMTLF